MQCFGCNFYGGENDERVLKIVNIESLDVKEQLASVVPAVIDEQFEEVSVPGFNHWD